MKPFDFKYGKKQETDDEKEENVILMEESEYENFGSFHQETEAAEMEKVASSKTVPRRRTTSIHSDRQANSTHTEENLPDKGRQDLITPKSFRRLNDEHIAQCKKKDLKLIKHRTIKQIA
ncbi:hypothetical protein AVEN_212624-1 [Araneus ventricosus]|uniref:Uncharacterized protein n=1 Tax=Araneus ventricosus TaxID=182803 RepID=A0A4Y2LI73_ARAVE|nr:hypothetical protein AVEN_212624-1 [Araneus ventricosus]